MLTNVTIMPRLLVLMSVFIATSSYAAGVNIAWKSKIPTFISSIETSKHVFVENNKVVWEENGIEHVTPFANSNVVQLKDQTLVSKNKAVAMVSWDL